MANWAGRLVSEQMPLPVTEQWDWQLYSACRDSDNGVFFVPENARGTARTNREEQAKAICADCQVQQACLDYALAVNEGFGVWGGLTPAERRSHRG